MRNRSTTVIVALTFALSVASWGPSAGPSGASIPRHGGAHARRPAGKVAPYLYLGWGRPPSATDVMHRTGVRDFTLSFVLSDGGCRPMWDGERPLRGGRDLATIHAIRRAGGDVVVSFGQWFGHDVGLTRQGLESAGLIVMRVATSISLVVLLTLTTPWPELLAALRSLRVPRMFVLIIGMAYRYLFVLLNVVGEMFTARKARTLRSDGDARAGRVFVASSAGTLFGKAHALSEEVHHAMVARGFTGNPRMLTPARLGRVDVAWLATSLALAIVVVGGDRALAG